MGTQRVSPAALSATPTATALCPGSGSALGTLAPDTAPEETAPETAPTRNAAMVQSEPANSKRAPMTTLPSALVPRALMAASAVLVTCGSTAAASGDGKVLSACSKGRRPAAPAATGARLKPGGCCG